MLIKNFEWVNREGALVKAVDNVLGIVKSGCQIDQHFNVEIFHPAFRAATLNIFERGGDLVLCYDESDNYCKNVEDMPFDESETFFREIRKTYIEKYGEVQPTVEGIFASKLVGDFWFIPELQDFKRLRFTERYEMERQGMTNEQILDSLK